MPRLVAKPSAVHAARQEADRGALYLELEDQLLSAVFSQLCVQQVQGTIH